MRNDGRGKEGDWFFDSGASSHMTRSEEGFKKHETVVNSVDTANNQFINSVARGQRVCRVESQRSKHRSTGRAAGS